MPSMNEPNPTDRPQPIPPAKKWKRPTKWWLVLLLLWIPAGLVGLNTVVTASGFCLSQMRYWTDDELIEVAVRKIAEREHSPIDAELPENDLALKNTEESIQSFLKNNPRCCYVARYPDERILLLINYIFGWNKPEVWVNYIRPIPRDSSDKTPFFYRRVLVSTCGVAGHSGRGMPTKTLEITGFHIRKLN